MKAPIVLAIILGACSPNVMSKRDCTHTRESVEEAMRWQLVCISQDRTTTYTASDEEEHDAGGWVRACEASSMRLLVEECKTVLYVADRAGGWSGTPCSEAVAEFQKKACKEFAE